MKVFLLYPDKDFRPEGELPPGAADLERDLGLDIVFDAMAAGDEFLREVARRVILTGIDNPEAARYRREITRDALEHPQVIRELYAIPLEFLERKRRKWLWVSPNRSSPTAILSSARELLRESLDLLRELRRIADRNVEKFSSAGFRRFFAMIQKELADGYLATVERQVRDLAFPRGVLLGVSLGRGNVGTGYFLCKPRSRGTFARLFSRSSPVYSYTLPPRDESGARALGELRDRGLAQVADTVARAATHVEEFFSALRWELAFYLGALNLRDRLRDLGEPVVLPEIEPSERRGFTCRGLYDAALALSLGEGVVANNVDGDGMDLTVITGPNRGGKTVFLRSVGQAYVLMRAGIFVPAVSFRASFPTGVFTHFPRGEDKSMESGKFEEELARLGKLVPHLRPGTVILFNESFSSTNEREGSEIARAIVEVFLRKGMRVFYVTHFYELARYFYETNPGRYMFLRAERLPDGTRTFRIIPGEPQDTGHGLDLYHRIFGTTTNVNRTSQ